MRLNISLRLIGSLSFLSFRFLREWRLAWPLAGIISLGTLPGGFIGGLIRLHWLPDPNHFKVFAGFALLYVGARLLIDICRKNTDAARKTLPRNGGSVEVELVSFSWSGLKYRFQDQDHYCGLWSLITLSLAVGIWGSM